LAVALFVVEKQASLYCSAESAPARMVDDGGGALFVYDGETFDGLALWKLKLEDVQVIGLRRRFGRASARRLSSTTRRLATTIRRGPLALVLRASR
jgi:hypothetical protein